MFPFYDSFICHISWWMSRVRSGGVAFRFMPACLQAGGYSGLPGLLGSLNPGYVARGCYDDFHCSYHWELSDAFIGTDALQEWMLAMLRE